MDILIDTNILLYKDSDHEVPTRLQELMEIVSDLNHRLVVHPLSISEVEEDKNVREKRVLLSRIKSYSKLQTVLDPTDDDTFFEKIGKPKNKWDQVDSFLLYCVYKNEVDFFVTEDAGIIKQASVLDISDKVMTFKNALHHFRKLKQKKVKLGDAPIICFYKKGENWYIGERDKEISFKDTLGFRFIHFLLNNEYKDFTPIQVYNCGKSAGDVYKTNLDEIINLGLHLEEPIFLKPMPVKEIDLRIELLEKKFDEDLLNDDRMIIEEEIAELNKKRKEKKPIRNSKSESENARRNVYRRVKDALEEINKNKETAWILKYLNKSTIKTGDNFIYKPVVTDKPHWILHSNQII